MDSGTSGGSMQSGSSGEDDQIDSSFSPAASSIPRLHHLPPQTQLHQPFFSSQNLQYPPLTNTMSLYPPGNSFLESLPQSDLDRIWSMTVNAHPQSHNQNQQMNMFYSATPSSSSLPASSNTTNLNPQTTQDPQLQLARGRSLTSSVAAAYPAKENRSTSGRVVKKRTRASRKTPTTVLTTDTTNFRAMVQEFTGIPTPPFGPSSLFPAKKFDLFGQKNGLDPSLASLLYSLNKSTNPNLNPFGPPQSNPFARNPNSDDNPYHHQEQQSQQIVTMPPSGSNIYANVNETQQAQNQNPNLAFQSSVQPLHPPFPSRYSGSNSGKNVERGGNENVSGTG